MELSHNLSFMSIRKFLWTLGTLLSGIFCGAVAAFIVLPIGYVMYESTRWPLTFVIAAVFAALGASWAGTLFAPTLSNVWAKSVLVVAQIAAFIFLSPVRGYLFHLLRTNFVVFIPNLIIIGLIAGFFALRFNVATRHLALLTRITIIVTSLTILAVATMESVLSLFGLIGI